MRYILVLLGIWIFSMSAGFAGGVDSEGKRPSKVDMDVSLTSQHLWRGTAQGAAPAVKPGLKFNITDDFNITSGAVYSVDRSYDEVDVSMSYKISDFQISLSDYYAPEDNGYSSESLFNYEQQTTDHYLDLQFDYTPFRHMPLSFRMATALYGNRFNEYNENRYSTYLETNYKLQQADYWVDFFFGISPGNSFYSEKFNVVNMGMTFQKQFEYSNDQTFPIAASIVGNPARKQLHVSFSLSLL